MATFLIYKCNHCNAGFPLSGPHEFYRNEQGELKQFGHPGPMTLEAKKAGIYGLYYEMYCFGCKRIVNVITLELETPIEGEKYGHIWIASKDKEKYPRKDIQKACPLCDSADVIYDISGFQCPTCGEGNLGSPLIYATS